MQIKMMTKYKCREGSTALLAAACFALATGSVAAQITETFTDSIVDAQMHFGGNAGLPVSLPKFNHPGTTLLKAELSITSFTGNAVFKFENLNGIEVDVQRDEAYTVQATPVGSEPGPFVLGASTTFFRTVPPYDGSPLFDGTSGFIENLPFVLTTPLPSLTVTDLNVLAANYTGAGTMDWVVKDTSIIDAFLPNPNNVGYTAFSSLVIKVVYTYAEPVLADCLQVTAVAGVPIQPQQMVGSGGTGGPYKFSATGLPPNLTLSIDGVLSGTPTAPGTFPYTVTVTDKDGNTGTLNCSVTIQPPSSADCAVINATVNVAITPVTLGANGGCGAPFTFSQTGLDAVGLTMTSGGTISGTPTVSGTFSYHVTVMDKCGNVGELDCSVTVGGDCTPTVVPLCYYKEVTSVWPVLPNTAQNGDKTITVGCQEYTEAQGRALLNLKASCSGRFISLAKQLLVVKLNILNSCNKHDCIDAEIERAESILCLYSGEKCLTDALKLEIKELTQKLEDYNGGLLCGVAKTGFKCPKDEECDDDNDGEEDHGKCYRDKHGHECHKKDSDGRDCWYDKDGNECHKDKDGNDCYKDRYGRECHKDKNGNHCYVKDGRYCHKDSKGRDCWYDDDGNECHKDSTGKIRHKDKNGNDCYVKDGKYCHKDSQGRDCTYDKDGRDCWKDNTGRECHKDDLGRTCWYDKDGNECHKDNDGNTCWKDKKGHECKQDKDGHICWKDRDGREHHEDREGCEDDGKDDDHDTYHQDDKECHKDDQGRDCWFDKDGNECHKDNDGNTCYKDKSGRECHKDKNGNECYVKNGRYCHKDKAGRDCWYDKDGNECFKDYYGREYHKDKNGNECYVKNGDYCHKDSKGRDCTYDDKGRDCWKDKFGRKCHEDSQGRECWYDKEGNECHKDSNGDTCWKDKQGRDCHTDKDGNTCWKDKDGNEHKEDRDACEDEQDEHHHDSDNCYHNSEGKKCHKDKDGRECWYNNEGKECHKDSRGNECWFDGTGKECHKDTRGNTCWYDNYGRECHKNSYGQTCTYDQWGRECRVW